MDKDTEDIIHISRTELSFLIQRTASVYGVQPPRLKRLASDALNLIPADDGTWVRAEAPIPHHQAGHRGGGHAGSP